MIELNLVSLILDWSAAVGGPEFAALLLSDVQELLTNGAVRPIVRKTEALALLRLLRKSTSDIEELLQHDVRLPAAVHPARVAPELRMSEVHVPSGSSKLWWCAGCLTASCTGALPM